MISIVALRVSVLIVLNISAKLVLCDGPEIVIIGAGVSGIAAASKLLENGLDDITILEAEDRLGGRVFTTQFGNYSVDMGGQWVHGEEGNAAFDLAWPLGLLEKSDEIRFDLKFYSSSGDKLLTYNQSKNIVDFYLKLDESPEEYAEKENFQSTGALYRKALNSYFELHSDVEEYKNQFLHLFELFVLSADSAMSWNDIAVNQNWGVPGDKSINWKERGYSIILDILMKKYPDPVNELPVMNKTKLNTQVSKIDYSDVNDKIKVYTKSGHVYKADHVIVTPSLGVLKASHDTLFEPNLPEEKISFIENFGFGSVTKIYLLFDHPWWMKGDTNFYGFNILWTDEDWSEREHNTVKEWELYIVGFFRVEHKPNLLSIWLVGKGARQIETIPEDNLKDQITELLQIFNKDYNVTEIQQMFRTQWFSNDHFRGTYSYYSVDAVKNHVNISKFAEPIVSDKPIILFAGEATDPRSFSTVHGAISAGWREAKRLLNMYKLY